MKFKPENGRCFSYKAPDYLRSAIITTIKIYLNQSQIEIYLHHPGQFCTWSVYSFTAQKRQIYTDVSHEVKNQIQKLNQIISVLRSTMSRLFSSSHLFFRLLEIPKTVKN